jgi:hypothetical protein
MVGTAAAATVQASWATIDDNGASNPLPNRRITRVTVDPGNVNTVYVTFGGFSGDNVYKSINGGASWVDITGPSGGLSALPNVPVRDLEVNPTNGNFLYAGTEVGIFTSDNGGASWNLPHDGPSNVSVDELFFLGADLVAVTHGRGMFNATVSGGGGTTVQPPTGLTALSIVGSAVQIGWTPPATGPAPTGYLLEGGVNPGEVLASIPAGAGPSYSFVAPTGAFYIRVHSLNGAERSSASNEIRIFVNVPAPPSAPASLLGLVNGSTLGLSWLNTFGGGAPTSMVLNVSGAITTALPLPVSEAFAYVGVPPGTYTFTVAAANGVGASVPSNPVMLTFPGACTGVPATPTRFSALKSGATITVSWAPPVSGPAVASYVLSVGGSFVGTFPTAGRTLSGTVAPGSYTLSVNAANACGLGPATTPVTVTVP